MAAEKLGAPKPDESFDKLFTRARTMERREDQYSAVAGDRSDSQNKNNKKVEKQPTQPVKQFSEPVSSEQAPGEPCRQGQGIQCRACYRFGYIARFCRFKQKKSAEAPGKSKDPMWLSSAELEQELSKRRLDGELELLDAGLQSNVQVVTGAAGPSYWLEVLVEGVAISAMVDTGLQSTIVSCSLLHKVFKQMQREGKPLPKLECLSTKLRGKDCSGQVHFLRGWQVYSCTGICTA